VTGSSASATGTLSPPPSTPGSTTSPHFTGRASRGIDKLLKAHGYNIVAPPESFLIGQGSTLLDGEAVRARRWGAAVGAAASNVSFAQRR
jgi:hypothetical protein